MRVWYTPAPDLSSWYTPCYAGDMAKKKTARTEAQIAAEERYAASREIIQVNIKFKSAADVKMFKRLRARFEDERDSAIVRKAVKELAAKRN